MEGRGTWAAVAEAPAAKAVPVSLRRWFGHPLQPAPAWRAYTTRLTVAACGGRARQRSSSSSRARSCTWLPSAQRLEASCSTRLSYAGLKPCKLAHPVQQEVHSLLLLSVAIVQHGVLAAQGGGRKAGECMGRHPERHREQQPGWAYPNTHPCRLPTAARCTTRQGLLGHTGPPAAAPKLPPLCMPQPPLIHLPTMQLNLTQPNSTQHLPVVRLVAGDAPGVPLLVLRPVDAHPEPHHLRSILQKGLGGRTSKAWVGKSVRCNFAACQAGWVGTRRSTGTAAQKHPHRSTQALLRAGPCSRPNHPTALLLVHEERVTE